MNSNSSRRTKRYEVVKLVGIGLDWFGLEGLELDTCQSIIFHQMIQGLQDKKKGKGKGKQKSDYDEFGANY